jgi:hypothetical protein
VHAVIVCYFSLAVLEIWAKKLQLKVMNDDFKFRCSKDNVG